MQEVRVPRATAAQQELRTALSMKQVELRDQLKELASRRNQLLEQRAVTNQAQHGSINERIAVIDKRTAQLETQLFATNDAIASSLGGPLVTIPEVDAVNQVQTQDANQADLIRGVVNAAVEEAVFGSFAAAITTVLASYAVWRGFRRFVLKSKPVASVPNNSGQIERLQQSMDVIAIEVERISEAQRYTAKLLNERGLPAGDAQQVPANQREASRVR